MKMNKFIIVHTYAGYVNKNSTQTKKRDQCHVTG